MESLAFQLMRVSQVIAHASERKGGVLVHGALAEWKGQGVLLEGISGAGKTTASKRLPSPWISHCDDVTLIVKTPQGRFWAHPWPTWSRYSRGDLDAAWEVSRGTGLSAIFLIRRADADRVSPVSRRQAIAEILGASEHVASPMAMGMERAVIRRLRRLRFDNIVNLVSAVPVSILDISMHGAFWGEIEKNLGVIP